MPQPSLKKVTTYSMALLLALVMSGCTNSPSPVESLSSIELGEPDLSATGSGDGEASQVNPVTDELAELEIDSQSGSGFEVVIEEVRLSLGDGFLVITNEEGEVLGYSVVTPDSQPVVVPLTFQAAFSQDLIGELFLDNGDGVFSRELDFPIRDEEGEVVKETFSFTLSE